MQVKIGNAFCEQGIDDQIPVGCFLRADDQECLVLGHMLARMHVLGHVLDRMHVLGHVLFINKNEILGSKKLLVPDLISYYHFKLQYTSLQIINSLKSFPTKASIFITYQFQT